MPQYKNAQSIGVYLSMPKGEVLTRAIINDALRQRKQIFVPYIYNSKVQDHPNLRSAMDMVSLHSKSDYERLEPDAWGIPSVAENSIAGRSRVLDDRGISGAISPEVTSSERVSRRSTELKRLDLIVMPGVAFDRDLGRLGHGKGFYDWFLKRYHDSKASLLGEETKMPFLGACLRSSNSKSVLLSLTHVLLVGLALDVQLLPDKIPTDAFDWRLDALVIGDGSVIRN